MANWIYLDNPPMQNYRSKSETAIIIVAGCLKYCRFQFFSPFQSSHFGFLFCVRRFVGFFLLFVGVLRRFNTGKHVQRQKNTKLAHRQKNMSPAIIPEKSNNFTYIGRCRCVYIYTYWAISKTLGSQKGHPQIWEGPIAYHTFVQ